MAQKANEISLPEKISNKILADWQSGHGGNADRVYMLQSEDGLGLMIPQALYQAEIDLTDNPAQSTRVLNRYLRTLLDTVSENLIPMVEAYRGQNVEEVIPLVDLRAGWVIAFYRFS